MAMTGELRMEYNKAVIGEYDAINIYVRLKEKIMAELPDDDPNKALAIKNIDDIINEERTHIGELMSIMIILDPEERNWLNKGEQEVREMMQNPAVQEEFIAYLKNKNK